MEQLKILIGGRSRVKASITRLVTAAERLTVDSTLDSVLTLIDRLTTAWGEFEKLGDGMYAYDHVEGYVDPSNDNEVYEDKYLKAYAMLISYKRSLEPTATKIERRNENRDVADDGAGAAAMSNATNSEAILQLLQQQQQLFERITENDTTTRTRTVVAPATQNDLPKIEVKKFAGDYKEWPSFKNMYESTVHNRQQLTNTQKLHYLKTYLIDDAANLIRHMPITDAAYETAWARLQERYDRPRHIVSALLDSFMSLPSTNKLDVSILRRVADGANEIVRGLDAVGHSERDCWIIHLILAKSDVETRRKWIEESRETNSPSLDAFFKFLDARCEEFELSQRDSVTDFKNTIQSDKQSRSSHSLVTVDGVSCAKCNSREHKLYSCSQFLGLSVEQRRTFVKEKQLCFNCLRIGHVSRKCSSKYTCKQCNGRHHTLIHEGVNNLQAANGLIEGQSDQSVAELASITISHVARTRGGVATECANRGTKAAQHGMQKSTLPTALVYVRNAQGTYTVCRVLLDSGSELSYISERCVQALGLARSPSHVLVSGISAIKAETTRGVTALKIRSRVSHHTLDITAHVLGKITSSLKRDNIDTTAFKVFDGLQLADDDYLTNASIDILVGSEYVWAVFTGQKVFDSQGNIIAISTIFGWVITSVLTNSSSMATSLHTTIDIDASLKRFWELEDVNHDYQKEPVNDKVEQHFLNTHTRDANGRYIVELPFKSANPAFADTLQGAISRFKAVERRLQQDTKLQPQYVDFMREYINLGHMREVLPHEIDTERKFYLPHHPVVGKKLRVVFDGSFKDINGKALNDELHIGPTIQRSLFSVFLRFRMYKFVFSADIVKMFRQIWVSENHRNYQRIVWRENPFAPMKHYQLCTVTYGTSSAPFLAVRVLEQLAHDHKNEFPTAARILLEDFYVDDVLTGSNNEEELLDKREELIQLLSCANLELGKWVSNTKRIHTQATNTITSIGNASHESSVKVLGIYWHPGNDTLSYNIALTTKPSSTKRQVLSDVSHIFDPLGLLAPVVIQFKILFQQLWLLDLGWDTPLPPKLAEWWLKCRDDLNGLKQLTLQRFVNNQGDDIELHAFSDASIKAYAAVVYCRTTSKDGTISVSIMAAKTRVAPLKQQSLPRLELCGALLLSRLIQSVKAGLQQQNVTVYAWCDSTIVLSWLSSSASKWKTFVANRVTEILETIPRNNWRHIDSKENPADCASRGMLAANLMGFALWWNGPSWLHDADQYLLRMQDLQYCSSQSDARVNGELRTTVLASLADASSNQSPLDDLIHRVSSWLRLVRIIAYVIRFFHRCRKSCSQLHSTSLTYEEITTARIICLRYAQNCFHDDRQLLLASKPLRTRSQLIHLSPIIGKNGLLRIGGRLGNSKLPPDVTHPVLLPKSHRITKLILEHEHWINLHPGVSALFVIVRQKYWILGARNLIRKITHDCVSCFRQRHHTSHQFMSDLPAVRVTQALPFDNTGCDYAGPILFKEARGRNPRMRKGYICLFVCLVTSALHLELATDLTTDAFLAALRRFISLRGKCAQIYSDNGKNFVGAKRALDEMQQLLASQQHNDTVSQALADEGIKWNFIPPHAPHWGGKWESAVRSVKLHLRRVIGKAVLTFEQMHTLLAQISAVVNSRPLYYTSDTDLPYLSPAHFLIGRPFTAIPETDLNQVPVNRLSYWQDIQAMYQGFWKRWHQEYLTTLQQRPKWTTKSPNVSIGNIVLIKDSNIAPSAWPLARVIETYSGKDGLVRAVKLKTLAGETTRPITKIAILPNSETTFQGGPGC